MSKLAPILILLLILFSETPSGYRLYSCWNQPKELLFSFAGQSKSIEDVIRTKHLASKVHARKLLMDVTLDYEYAKPNPKNDPGRGRPGRNP